MRDKKFSLKTELQFAMDALTDADEGLCFCTYEHDWTLQFFKDIDTIYYMSPNVKLYDYEDADWLGEPVTYYVLETSKHGRYVDDSVSKMVTYMKALIYNELRREQ